jgi:hypothetical protein
MIPRQISTETLRNLAESHGICVNPIVHRVLDTEKGREKLVATPCGATLSSKCVPCAERARRLRELQCRVGWHMDEEPEGREREASTNSREEMPQRERRARSTKRRQDAPDLPRLPIEQRTVGKAFRAPSGRVYRPSMFVTFTLPSYGAVRRDGTPVDPDTYDYRRAALDAMHFPKLIDRVWQNLRRCTGFQAQYFATVELQRRMVPHLHSAIRGAVPREILRMVAAATYHQVWWPRFDEVIYPEGLEPVWDGAGYADPRSGRRLRSWDRAVNEIAEDARPVHTLRLGKQMDIQGIIASEGDADRRAKYLTKYLMKSFGETAEEEAGTNRRQRAHARRIRKEVRWLPCSPRCANWLRYGIQPQHARAGMVAGSCSGRAHHHEHLGCGGRRVLVSRKWTGKTLAHHKADVREVVRQTLLAADMTPDEIAECSTDVLRPDGRPRFEWRLIHPDEATMPLYRATISRSLAERLEWRDQYEKAKARASPSTGPPRPPDNQPSLVGDSGGHG